nr:hypothetical protein [Tanacetum cinerariifolium]
MDMLDFIQVVDPTKVKVRERERAKGEAKLLDSTGDSAAGGGQETETELVTRVRIIADENVVAEKPKRPRKKRQAVTDASGSFHPPKKLIGDHETFSGVATGGKSSSVLKELLASSMLNVEVGVAAVATLPLVTFSVSATPEHESGVLTDYITGLNLRTIGAPKRFVISSDSSYHSSTNASRVEGYSIIRSVVFPSVMTEAVVTSHVVNVSSVPETGTKVTSLVHASMFHDFDSTKTAKADTMGPSYFAKQDLSMGSRELNSKTLHQIREMDYHHLFTEFNVGTARQACLNVEAKDDEVENLKPQLPLKETEAAEATCLRAQLKDLNVVVSSLRSQKDGLVDQVHALETTCFSLCDQVLGYEQLKEQIEEFQDAQINIVNDKVAKLEVDLLEMALHLEEKFYPHLHTTISDWSRAIEKEMQDGLSAHIDHEKASMSLANVVAYNLVAESDYNSASQRLREVNFPLLAELKSYKDASTADVMDMLRLEGPLADAPGMSDLHPDVKQLTLPIHRPEDQVVLGETSLSFALSVTHSRVERIKENVAAQRSTLIDVWVPLVDPLSAKSLIGETSTSDSVPATVVTTTALSTTFASASFVPPITIEDYEIVGMDGPDDAQGNGQGNVASFPTVEFEKEELDCNDPLRKEDRYIIIMPSHQSIFKKA